MVHKKIDRIENLFLRISDLFFINCCIKKNRITTIIEVINPLIKISPFK